jgi:ribosome recycling factor
MGIVEDVFGELSTELNAVTDSLQKNLSRLRTGRANASLLDGIRVDYYGNLTALSQCAQVNVPEPRLITVKPWEKAILSAIEKAIMTSELGLNPQNDGEMIRLPIPQLTEERRKDLVKQAKGRGEEAKIGIRNHRRDANEMLKAAEKDKEISQDDLKRALDKVQVTVDKGIGKVDEILTSKEQEILEI